MDKQKSFSRSFLLPLVSSVDSFNAKEETETTKNSSLRLQSCKYFPFELLEEIGLSSVEDGY